MLGLPHMLSVSFLHNLLEILKHAYIFTLLPLPHSYIVLRLALFSE